MMRVPIATYRIQFNLYLGFREVKKIIPYLAELGISDIYASPIFRARKGSLHGYDVVDPNKLNPELGSKEDFEGLVGELKNRGMGWLQDFIPNHMAYNYENQMLMDVLENGPASRFSNFFDIEWEHPYKKIRGKLLAPFLGRPYKESLKDGEIQLSYDGSGLAVNYYDNKFPLLMETYTKVLVRDLNELKMKLGKNNPDFSKFLNVIKALKNLPSKVKERDTRIKFIKRTLRELYMKNRKVRKLIDKNIKIINGEKGNPKSFGLLDKLLSEQLFRLSFWKLATRGVDYRRFFNINELICLRMEDQDVFDHVHSLIFKLIEDGKVDGLRIDHVDGLYDPAGYLGRMRRKVKRTYTIVEKILNIEEDFPPWPVQGTTGYDFLNFLNGIFCCSKNKEKFDNICSGFTGLKKSYEDILYDKKKLMIKKHMAGDVDNLVRLLLRISGEIGEGDGITFRYLKRAIVEVMSLFPIYRTYVDRKIFSKADRSYINRALEKAMRKNPSLLREINFVKKFLLLNFHDLNEEEKDKCVHFVMRFQQFTGPLMAKGFEDTFLYIYNRLLSLNEVGGSPDRFGIALEEFYNFNKRRAKIWPHSLNATSTHDTKRGEDVRARINVLSEMPLEWGKNLKRWNNINKRKKKNVNGIEVPDKNDEYFLYQTLVGAFPFNEKEYPAFLDRIKNYLIKSAREAKVHTAWLEPNAGYENALISFVEGILGPSEKNQFLTEFLSFQKKIAHYGMLNSLSQTLIKITSPGVPDFYQGTELWDLSLVDPDNRRPVDFERRRSFLLDSKRKAGADVLSLVDDLLSTGGDGRIKLFLIYKTLNARKENLETFQKGSYIPVKIGGKFKNHVIAFARNHKQGWAITIAPRFLSALVKEGEYPIGRRVWRNTYIFVPEGAPTSWRDAITGQFIKAKKALPIGEILKHSPVSLLISEGKR